jgi:hypothetical protein
MPIQPYTRKTQVNGEGPPDRNQTDAIQML